MNLPGVNVTAVEVYDVTGPPKMFCTETVAETLAVPAQLIVIVYLGDEKSLFALFVSNDVICTRLDVSWNTAPLMTLKVEPDRMTMGWLIATPA